MCTIETRSFPSLTPCSSRPTGGTRTSPFSTSRPASAGSTISSSPSTSLGRAANCFPKIPRATCGGWRLSTCSCCWSCWADWLSSSEPTGCSPEKLGAVPRGPLSPDAILLVSFAVASYLVWYVQFRIPRYLVTVKILALLVCVLLLLDLFRTRRRVWIASSVLLVLIAARIDVPNFGRRDWRETYFDYKVPMIKNAQDGIVLIVSYWECGAIRGSAPFAAVVTEMPQCMRYIKIDSNEIANPWGNKPLAMEQQVLRLVRDIVGRSICWHTTGRRRFPSRPRPWRSTTWPWPRDSPRRGLPAGTRTWGSGHSHDGPRRWRGRAQRQRPSSPPLVDR